MLPLEYAGLLGYGPGDLTRSSAQQVAGRMDVWQAANPLSAMLPGIPVPFDLHPIFIAGALNPLWGQFDFFVAWDGHVGRSGVAAPA